MKSNSSLGKHPPEFVLAIFGTDHDDVPTFLGSGWYAASGVVATCKHVVRNELALRADKFLVRHQSSDNLLDVHKTILCDTDDLALLRIRPLDFKPPALLTGLTLDLLPKLRSWLLSAFGFDEDDQVPTLKRYLMQESLILTGAVAASGTITDLQFSGGIPSGFSGGPLVSLNATGWVCTGMLRLGKKEAATSRVIAPDKIKDFFDEQGVEHRFTDAEELLSSDFLNSTADERLEVKQIAVLFTDMANSTEFAEKFGSRAAYQKRKQHNDLLLPLIEVHRGTLVEIVGDALFAVFDAPQDAARCAVAMQQKLKESNRSVDSDIKEWEIHIRIGVHFGKALVARDATRLWVVGQAVNVAARVESGGGKRPDRILVSREMMTLLTPFNEFDLQDIGVISAKGVGDLHLYSLAWDDEERAGPLPLPQNESDPPPTLAAATAPVSDLSHNVGACHCLFVDPRDGRGYVVPVYASVKPSNHFSVSCSGECDKDTEAAADGAVRAAFEELNNLGFARPSLERQEVRWWINKPGVRCTGASLGLGVALATVAAHTGVQIDTRIAVTGALNGECVVGVEGITSKWNALRISRKFNTLILPSANIATLPRDALDANDLHVIDVPTLHAAVLDVFGPAFGLAARRLSAATMPVTTKGETVQIELWVQRAADRQLTRDIAIVSEEATHNWRIGDSIRICARTDRGCHLAIANIGTSGKVTVLVPNDHQRDTWIEAGQIVAFPPPSARISFQLQGPPGTERLVAIAASRPLKLRPEDFHQSGAFLARPTTRDIAILADNVADSILGRTEIDFYVSANTAELMQTAHSMRSPSESHGDDYFCIELG